MKDVVEYSAEGMIRNFGPNAAEQARQVAARYRDRDIGACRLWTAIAEEIARRLPD